MADEVKFYNLDSALVALEVANARTDAAIKLFRAQFCEAHYTSAVEVDGHGCYVCNMLEARAALTRPPGRKDKE